MTLPFASEDVDQGAASLRVTRLTASTLDYLAFLRAPASDDAWESICQSTVGVSIAALLMEYRINVALGLLPKALAIEGVTYALSKATLGGSFLRDHNMIQRWDTRGSHLVIADHAEKEHRLPMRDVARLLLRRCEPLSDPVSAYARILKAQNRRLFDALRWESSRNPQKMQLYMEARALISGGIRLLRKLSGITE